MYLSDWMSTSPYSTGYCIQTNFHLTFKFKATARIRLEHAYIQRNNKQVKCVENPAVLLKFARGITEQTISSFSTYGLKPALILCVCVCVEHLLPQNFLPQLSSESTLSTASSRIATVPHLPQLTYNPHSAPHLSLLDCLRTLPWPCEIMQTREFSGCLCSGFDVNTRLKLVLSKENGLWDGGTNSSCFFVCVTIRILIWTVVQLN